MHKRNGTIECVRSEPTGEAERNILAALDDPECCYHPGDANEMLDRELAIDILRERHFGTVLIKMSSIPEGITIGGFLETAFRTVGSRQEFMAFYAVDKELKKNLWK